MDINWQTDRSSVKDGGTYLITEIADGKREVFFEDSYDEKKKTFNCEYQLGEDNEVIAFAPFEEIGFDLSKIHTSAPDDGDYHLVGVRDKDGGISLNVDMYFAASGRWGCFANEEIAGWFDWPEPYMGPIAQEKSKARSANPKAKEKTQINIHKKTNKTRNCGII